MTSPWRGGDRGKLKNLLGGLWAHLDSSADINAREHADTIAYSMPGELGIAEIRESLLPDFARCRRAGAVLSMRLGGPVGILEAKTSLTRPRQPRGMKGACVSGREEAPPDRPKRPNSAWSDQKFREGRARGDLVGGRASARIVRLMGADPPRPRERCLVPCQGPRRARR